MKKIFTILAIAVAGCTSVQPATSLEGNMMIYEYGSKNLVAVHYVNTVSGDTVLEIPKGIVIQRMSGPKIYIPNSQCSIRWTP